MPVIISVHITPAAPAVIQREMRGTVEDTARYASGRARLLARQRTKSGSGRYADGFQASAGRPRGRGNGMEADVTNDVPYAGYLENGTGIYGPRGQVIRPKQAKALAWMAGGKMVFAAWVRGTPAKHVLRDTLTDEGVIAYFRGRALLMLERLA